MTNYVEPVLKNYRTAHLKISIAHDGDSVNSLISEFNILSFKIRFSKLTDVISFSFLEIAVFRYCTKLTFHLLICQPFK